MGFTQGDGMWPSGRYVHKRVADVVFLNYTKLHIKTKA